MTNIPEKIACLCLHANFGDKEKIELIQGLMKQYKSEGKDFADEHEYKEFDNGHCEIRFKNPNSTFIGDIKILYRIDLRPCHWE